MKFNNGCWLFKEGTACFSPHEVYYTRISDTEVTLCAPTHPIAQRGATLGGINLTIRISSPMPDVLRIQTGHHTGRLKRAPSFDLKLNDPQKLQVEDREDKITVTTGSLTLAITKNPWSMTYTSGGKVLTASGNRDLALMKTDYKGDFYEVNGDLENTFIREQLNIGVGELLYGTGERFTPFVKNGQSVEIYNEDGGTSTEQAYKNIPFFLSNKGYGVLVNHPERVSMEFGTENVTKTSFCVEGGSLDYF